MMAPALAEGFKAAMSKDEAKLKLDSAMATNGKVLAEINTRYLEITELKCTASGAIIHELTHMVLDTKDVKSPLSPLMACYGAALCIQLASVDGDKAKDNADNYRLFAECCQM